MQLRNARLCLDCEEVHDSAHCPACASESFAFIKRWVPTPSSDATQGGPPVATLPQRRERPQVPPPEPTSKEALDTYRELLGGRPAQPAHWRLMKRSAMGLALAGLAGWAWKQQNQRATGAHTVTPGPDGNRTDDED